MASKSGAKKSASKKAPATSTAKKAAGTKAARTTKAATTKGSTTTKKSAPKKAVTKKAATATATTRKATPAKKAAAAKKAAPAKKAAARKSAPATKAAPAKATATAKKAVPAKKAQAARATKATTPKKATASPYDAKFLDEMRKALLEERAGYTRTAETAKADAEALAEMREPGDVQFDDESGEGDTLAVERDFDLALSAQARHTVEEIDHALAKIDAGTYGLCETSDQPIPKERLRAIPWARKRVEYQVGSFGNR